MFTFRSKNSRKSPMGDLHTRVFRKARKPTPVMDHQGAVTPPTDRAYLRDLSHAHTHVCSRLRAYSYTCIVSPVRANDSNVQKDGKRWVHGRTSGAMAVLGLLSDSCTRPSSTRPERVTWKDREKEEVKRERQCRQHNRRVSVKIYPCTIHANAAKRDKPRLLATLGYWILGTEQSLFASTRVRRI